MGRISLIAFGYVLFMFDHTSEAASALRRKGAGKQESDKAPRLQLNRPFWSQSEGAAENSQSLRTEFGNNEDDDETNAETFMFWDRVLEFSMSISTEIPSSAPTGIPSSAPTSSPTPMPSTSSRPSIQLSSAPTSSPTPMPSTSSRPSLQPSRFATILSLQNETGVCNGDSNGFGCADVDGNGSMGNPNDAVNCYDITNFGESAPFILDTVRFWLGDSIPLPGDLSVRVWSGTATGGPTDEILLSQELSTFSFGENTARLDTPLQINTNEICVGLFSANVMDGLRVTSEMGAGDRSYTLAPECGANDFTTLESFGFSLNYCIEAFVSG